MAISNSISRLADYQSRHGLGATIRRIVLAIGRSLFSNREVVFYCDLSRQTSPPPNFPKSLKVERKRGYDEVSPDDLRQIINVWNPRLAHRLVNERFANGASLWLIKFEDRLAGYGWTLQGCTIKPHYVPLGKHDVHLFDFQVFPRYRGRRLNPILVEHILNRLAVEGGARAFVEAAEWNQAQLSSLAKTAFHLVGMARKLNLFGHTVVCWNEGDMARQVREPRRKRGRGVSPDQNTSQVLR